MPALGPVCVQVTVPIADTDGEPTFDQDTPSAESSISTAVAHGARFVKVTTMLPTLFFAADPMVGVASVVYMAVAHADQPDVPAEFFARTDHSILLLVGRSLVVHDVTTPRTATVGVVALPLTRRRTSICW